MTTPFDDLETFVALPRISGLALSPGGDRLLTGVAVLDPKRTGYVTALWEVDPAGVRPARRVTRSAEGESVGVFAPNGDHLFVSRRPDPAAEKDEDAKPALWLLPADGGEPRQVGRRAGGLAGPAVAHDAGTVAVLGPTLPGSATEEEDASRRKRRKERKIAAILHESYPIRYWDHDLGPAQNRLFVADPLPGTAPRDEDGAPSGDPAEPAAATPAGEPEPTLTWRELTPAPGRSLDEAGLAVSPDGRYVATTWEAPERGGRRSMVRVLDAADGAVVLTVDDPDHEFGGPVFSPDGRRLLVRRTERGLDGRAPDVALAIAEVDPHRGPGGPIVLGHADLTPLAADWDRWPGEARWSPDGATVFAVADEEGASPVFAIDVRSGAVTRLTGDRGAYGDLCVSPDGATVYAVRSAVDAPPQVVRLRSGSAWQEPVLLPGPAAVAELPGRLTEVTARAEDGTPLRGWLVLPRAAAEGAPAPLLVWIHGGPLHSWNAWSWRWNPWLAAARGYAVLLPDPALSTGYGHHFVARGWRRWGAEPYTDILALTDAALQRTDLDADRTAAMGGSFGGYMANWVAGHTDRFRGIVSHAGLWALDQFGPTTDAYDYWRVALPPEAMMEWSPHRFVDRITTPMLVIHGDKDYRVPVGEGIRLWAELTERSSSDGTTPHRFLYFPDENHWVLSPQHAVVWYETVFSFLAHTVHDQGWVVPDTLR